MAQYTHEATRVDPLDFKVNLSKEVLRAFGDLEAAVHTSDHFDAGTLKTLQAIAAGKPMSVHGFVISFPQIAEETFRHIHATGDRLAVEAWHGISSEMVEHGFTLQKSRSREK